ncbi:MAG: Hsp70 family protein, partial [Nitrosotalea sp.]
DKVLIDYVVDSFRKTSGVDISKDSAAMVRVREAAEKAKIELSSIFETDINLPFISYEQSSGPKNLELKITRAKFEELINPIVERCRPSVTKSMEDAKLTPADISKIILVGGPTRIPLVKKFVANLMGKEPEAGIDPMEAVALGAAVQAGIIGGEVTSDIVLLDVTPLTLGLEVLGGLREPIIDRNTTIPTSKSKVFTTAADNQTAVTIHVVQGERPMATDNVSLGSFNLSGILPAPRGIPQIEVKFDIDANGILNVAAKDLATQKEAKITISASTKLAKEDIEKMTKDAELFSEQDKKKKEEVLIKNEAQQSIYAAETLISQQKDKISQDQGVQVSNAIKELKDVLDKSVEEIKPKLDSLTKLINDISTELYKNATPSPGAAAQGGPETTTQNGPDASGQDAGNSPN